MLARLRSSFIAAALILLAFWALYSHDSTGVSFAARGSASRAHLPEDDAGNRTLGVSEFRYTTKTSHSATHTQHSLKESSHYPNIPRGAREASKPRQTSPISKSPFHRNPRL